LLKVRIRSVSGRYSLPESDDESDLLRQAAVRARDRLVAAGKKPIINKMLQPVEGWEIYTRDDSSSSKPGAKPWFGIVAYETAILGTDGTIWIDTLVGGHHDDVSDEDLHRRETKEADHYAIHRVGYKRFREFLDRL
jgi:hypothetical protein